MLESQVSSDAMVRVAVVGAGLSGLVAAQQLREHSAVEVFEKSRGYGGRLATRYGDEFEFDHGAQFFTARSPEFQKFLEPLQEWGVVARWDAQFAELDRAYMAGTRKWDDDNVHYVGAPRMNAIGRYLGDSMNVHRDTRVASVERSEDGWELRDDANKSLGYFDWVVCALPAAQAQALLPMASTLVEIANDVQMHACYALMLGFEKPLPLPWQAALVRNADISWISVNSSKPKRADRFTLVAHSTNDFADANMDLPLTDVQDHLLNEVSEIVASDCDVAVFRQLHRWRYANTDRRSGPDSLVDEELQLAACGDWFGHGRVEAAYLSGLSVAGKLRKSFSGGIE